MSEKFKQGLRLLIARITLSYREFPVTSYHTTDELPSREEVIEITELIRQLLFPGYFGNHPLKDVPNDFYIGDLLITIHKKLTTQLVRALQHQLPPGSDTAGLEEKAEDICCQFLDRIPTVREYLATDVQAAFDGDPAADNKELIVFAYPCIFAISIYRLAHELYRLEVPLIPRIMSEYAHSATGIEIHPGAEIGRYFFIDHGTGIVIGQTAVIGENVKLYQGVTLGALSTRGGQSLRNIKRHPTLEDNVTVYSGATILGGETVIGEGAVIGGNVFITSSVEPWTKVSIKSPDLLFAGGKPKKEISELGNDWCI